MTPERARAYDAGSSTPRDAAIVDVAARHAAAWIERSGALGYDDPFADMRMVKAIYLIRRKPGMSPEDFHRYWREVHGAIAARIPGMRRYVQCHTIESAAPADYDGAAEAWFDDLAAVQRAVASPEYAAAREDERRFIDLERTTLIFTEEVPIIA